MQVKYFPARNPDYSLIKGQAVGLSVLLPDGYPNGSKYPWELLAHGISERSGGTLENLKNLVEGVDYNRDGLIDGGFIKPFHRELVDKKGIVLIIPTYDGFFDSAKVNWVRDFALNNFSLVDKGAFGGFSYGGGAVVAFAKSSVENAKKFAVFFPCAPTNEGGGSFSYLAQAGTPMHVFVNDEDDNPYTDIDVTRDIVSKFNQSNPSIKVQYTAFRQKYHGGFDKATDIVPPTAPGGQGVINLSETVHDWYLDVLKNGNRSMKTGIVVQPAPTPIPPKTIQAVASFIIDGDNIHLIGDKSIGQASGGDGRWEFVSAPAGVTKGQVFPGGSTYINADGKLPKPGIYKFQFFLKGVENPVDVTVEYGTSMKTPVGFNSATDLVIYSDGSSEKATAICDKGEWTVKTINGKIIDLS